MGTWTRNVLVRNADPEAVRTRLISWLERKGFDLSKQGPWFQDLGDDERALYLVSNREWTVVLYSEGFQEGDRLLLELKNWPVIVEVVIIDSDVWGYDLLEDAELTASFNSNPEYFGGNDQKLPRNGDPERLCRVLGLEGREGVIRCCQAKRAFFADFPCRSFCQEIGASPGSLNWSDFGFRGDGSAPPNEVAGWRIETLFFARRRSLGEELPEPVLHSLVPREFRGRDSRASVDPELEKRLNQQVRILHLLFKPLGWICRALGPVIRWWLRRKFNSGGRKSTLDPFLDGLSKDLTAPISYESGWLLNRRYQLRIQCAHPPDPPAEDLLRSPNEIFRFRAAGLLLLARAVRPEQVRRLFVLTNERVVTSDEQFLIQEQPARATVFSEQKSGKPRFEHQWFMEFEHFIVSVSYISDEPIRPETSAEVRRVFETLGKIPRP